MSEKIDISTLRIFIENPAKEFHVREIARMLNISPTTAGNNLKKLKKDKYLLQKKELGHIRYRAKTDSENYKDIKTYYNIRKIKNSGLVEFLITKLNYPETIILFGSYAKAENTPISDIDIFILSETKKEPNVTNFEKILGCKLQLFLTNKKKLNQMIKDSKELLNNILNGKILYGYFEVF